MTEETKQSQLFLHLVLTFQAAAWQQMGKIKNPLTDKVERDLAQARFSIDILDMLKSKTRGNLNDNEEQFLSKVLSELQINFVAEQQKPEDEPGAEESAGQEKGESPENSEK